MVLEAVELNKVFAVGSEQVHALTEVSCRIARGSWTTISGPSGSGKSTLLSLMAALDRPTSGVVRVDGKDISYASDVRQARYRKERIGVIFQEYRLMEQVNAWENVAMPLVTSGLGRGERKKRGMALLEKVGLVNRAGHLPRQLSGGERQRVAAARALVHDPDILFADEPTANIDQGTAGLIMELFRELHRQGHTLVIISHDPAMGVEADQRILMDRGRLTA